MLVLQTKKGDDILIDGAIKVTVVAVKGRRVRLGVDAPEDIDIVRSELIQQSEVESEGSRQV